MLHNGGGEIVGDKKRPRHGAIFTFSSSNLPLFSIPLIQESELNRFDQSNIAAPPVSDLLLYKKDISHSLSAFT